MESANLYPELEAAPKLVGIAKLASEGESIREGHNVEYFTLPVRSLLNKCDSPRMPFTWTVNPYRGCEFACKYCYARYTHEFMEMRDGVDFERKIYVKQNPAWLLRRDLKKVKPGESIAIGTATDPYQPAEKRYEMTRGILEELSLHAGFEIGIVTKSTLVLRDLDLLRKISERNRISVSITVTTTDIELARILEPRAPRPDLRIEAAKRLALNGILTGVLCCPVIPGITDSLQNLESVVRAATDAGVHYLWTNPLFLKPCSEKVFMPFVEEKFPHLAQRYKALYAQNAYLSPAYRKRISDLMKKLKAKYGIVGKRYEEPPLPGPAEQMSLFGGAPTAQPKRHDKRFERVASAHRINARRAV